MKKQKQALSPSVSLLYLIRHDYFCLRSGGRSTPGTTQRLIILRVGFCFWWFLETRCCDAAMLVRTKISRVERRSGGRFRSAGESCNNEDHEQDGRFQRELVTQSGHQFQLHGHGHEPNGSIIRLFQVQWSWCSFTLGEKLKVCIGVCALQQATANTKTAKLCISRQGLQNRSITEP